MLSVSRSLSVSVSVCGGVSGSLSVWRAACLRCGLPASVWETGERENGGRRTRRDEEEEAFWVRKSQSEGLVWLTKPVLAPLTKWLELPPPCLVSV